MAIEDGYCDVNGARLHYLRAGTGPRAIVLSHGNSHCGGVWAPLVEALAGDQFTVVALDLRGHGWSEKTEEGYSWAGLRDDLVGVVRALDFQDVFYVGHSRGGGVSLLAAAATPDITRGVVVYEPTVPVQPGPSGEPAPVTPPARAAEMADRALRRREVFPSRDELMTYYRSRDGFREWRDDYFQSFIEYGSSAREDGAVELCMPPRSAAKLFEATYGFDAWRDTSCPDLPVLVLFGGRSGRVVDGRDPAAGIRTMFPRCESRIIAGATHTGPMEQPELFEQIVRERIA
ncbi:MAG: alpha/beta fold hydrolase [Dehalococcoidia bacterium]